MTEEAAEIALGLVSSCLCCLCQHQGALASCLYPNSIQAQAKVCYVAAFSWRCLGVPLSPGEHLFRHPLQVTSRSILASPHMRMSSSCLRVLRAMFEAASAHVPPSSRALTPPCLLYPCPLAPASPGPPAESESPRALPHRRAGVGGVRSQRDPPRLARRCSHNSPHHQPQCPHPGADLARRMFVAP